MNILYFASLDFYARPNPSFHLMKTMIEDVLTQGHSVYFVGCSLEGISQHIPEKLEANPRFTYRLIPVPNTKKTNLVKRYTDGVAYAAAASKYLKKFMPLCDLVFVQSSPTALFNVLAARKHAKNKCVIYNVQDMFPGSSIASGAMKNKFLQKFFYDLQKIAYAKSDIIVGISEDMKKKLEEQGVPSEKIDVVVNWFDDQSVSEIPWKVNDFAREFGMSRDKFYVQYAGTMGYVFEFEKIIKLAELLRDRDDVVFQMIGEGSRKEEFIAAAKKSGLSNIEFLPLQPQERVSEVYSACDLCLIPLKRGVIGNSVPSKIALLMACKRPILTFTDMTTEYAQMINGGIGAAFDYDDVEGMANAIDALSRDREKVVQMGKNGFEFGCKLYSRSANMKKYLEIFEKAKEYTRSGG